MQYVTLNTGAQMPMEGFGVFRVPDPKECEDSVYEAIRVVHLDRGYSGSRAKHFEPSFVRMCLGKE